MDGVEAIGICDSRGFIDHGINVVFNLTDMVVMNNMTGDFYFGITTA